MTFAITRCDISATLVAPLLLASLVGSSGLFGLEPATLQEGLDPAEYFHLKSQQGGNKKKKRRRRPYSAGMSIRKNNIFK